MNKRIKAMGITVLMCSICLSLSACATEGSPEASGEEVDKKQAMDDKKQETTSKTEEGEAPAAQSAQKSQGEAQGEEQQPRIKPDVALHAELIALETNGIKSTAAVCVDQDLAVAVDVSQWRRFQLNGIRKEIFDHLRDEYPDMDIHVSTDRKIFWEMRKLEKDALQDGADSTKIQTRLQKLDADMKG